MNIFEADIKDDVTAKSEAMTKSISDLADKVEFLGDAFRQQQKAQGAFNIGLKDATALFRRSAGNLTLFRQAMKAAGASTLQTNLLTQHFTKQLVEEQKELLGLKEKAKEAQPEVDKLFHADKITKFNQALEIAKTGFGFFKDVVGGYIHKQFDQARELVGEVVESAQLRQDTLVALKDTIKGTAEQKEKQAEDLYMFAAKAAALTPLDTDYIIEQQKELLEQGYSPDETKQLVALISDQQSEFKGETGHFLTEALTRMKSRGYITNRDFESLRAAKIPMEEVYVRLAKELGISTDDKEKAIKLVRKQATKGNVSLSQLLNSVMDQAVAKHGALGTFSIKNSETLTGAISNFKNAFGDLLKMGDPTKWRGLEVFTNFLVRAQRLITDQKGAGGRMLKEIEYFVNSTLGGLDKIKDSDIERYLDFIGDKLHWAGDRAGELWGWIDRVLHANSLDEGLHEAFKSIGPIVDDLGTAVGKAIAKGVMLALKESIPSVKGLLSGGVQRATIGEAGQKAGIKNNAEFVDLLDRAGVNPYKRRLGEGLDYLGGTWLGLDVFDLKKIALQQKLAESGGDAGVPSDLKSAASDAGVSDPSQLMSVPRMAGGGYVDKPTLALIGERGPERVVPAGSGSGVRVDASITIGSVPAGTNMHSFADMLTTMQARKITAALERLNLE